MTLEQVEKLERRIDNFFRVVVPWTLMIGWCVMFVRMLLWIGLGR